MNNENHFASNLGTQTIQARHWPRQLAKILLIFLSSMIALFIVMIAFRFIIDYMMKKPIKGNTPDAFPVVIFWNSQYDNKFHARVIELQSVAKFKQEHKNASFMLPPGLNSVMLSELQKQADGIDSDIAKEYTTSRQMYVWANLLHQTTNSQKWKITFQHGNDHVNVSHYDATYDTVTPTHIERYFGPGTVFAGCPFILLALAGLIWFSVKMIGLIPYFKNGSTTSHAT